MGRKTSVVIVERLPLFREALARMLTGLGAEVVGISDSLPRKLKHLRTLSPHVIVLDRDAIDGDVVEAIHAVREASPKTRMILLFGRLDGLDIRRAARAGVCDCLLEAESASGLERAFRRVLAKARTRSGRAGGRGAKCDADDARGSKRTYVLAQLTKRELAVLPYIARGFTVKETSEILFLSPKTIDHHKMHLMAKLGVHDRVALARLAIREGVIPVWEA
jgi:DNA-binding NarL/FixJ family response regulator